MAQVGTGLPADAQAGDEKDSMAGVVEGSYGVDRREMMDIYEIKNKVVGICTDLGGGLPYETDQIDGGDWDEIATELAELARGACIAGNRIAAYAGIARRKANSSGGKG
jgi:hypothetical protein